MLFRFDDAGRFESIHVKVRARTVGGGAVPTSWQERMSNYEIHGQGAHPARSGMGAPRWLKPYWRGRIPSLSHEFAHERRIQLDAPKIHVRRYVAIGSLRWVAGLRKLGDR